MSNSANHDPKHASFPKRPVYSPKFSNMPDSSDISKDGHVSCCKTRPIDSFSLSYHIFPHSLIKKQKTEGNSWDGLKGNISGRKHLSAVFVEGGVNGGSSIFIFGGVKRKHMKHFRRLRVLGFESCEMMSPVEEGDFDTSPPNTDGDLDNHSSNNLFDCDRVNWASFLHQVREGRSISDMDYLHQKDPSFFSVCSAEAKESIDPAASVGCLF